MATINITEHEVGLDLAAELLEHYIAKRQSTMLWGTYGLGKSSIVFQVGEKLRRKVIDFRLNIREPVDMRGIPVVDATTRTTVWCVPDELPQVERDGEFGILFLDEINTGTPQMLAVAMQLVLDGKVGDYTLPAGWVVVAAGNRVTDRAAAIRMPTALRNRFRHIYVKADVEAWCSWAVRADVRPELIAFIRLRRELLHIPFKGDENATPTPRSLVGAAEHFDAPKRLRLRLLAGCIGDAAGAELDGFLDLYESIGSLEDIVNHPDTAKVPTESSIRFAVCTGLGRIANRKNFTNVVTFAKRLPRESEVLIVSDATHRDASLKNTSTYGAWAVANQDIIVQAA